MQTQAHSPPDPMVAEIAFLKDLLSRVDTANAVHLAKAIGLLEQLGDGESFSAQADRHQSAARSIRDVDGIDGEDHNALCLIAERLDETAKSLILISNNTGY